MNTIMLKINRRGSKDSKIGNDIVAHFWALGLNAWCWFFVAPFRSENDFWEQQAGFAKCLHRASVVLVDLRIRFMSHAHACKAILPENEKTIENGGCSDSISYLQLTLDSIAMLKLTCSIVAAKFPRAPGFCLCSYVGQTFSHSSVG